MQQNSFDKQCKDVRHGAPRITYKYIGLQLVLLSFCGETQLPKVCWWPNIALIFDCWPSRAKTIKPLYTGPLRFWESFPQDLWSLPAGIFFHLAKRTFVRSGTDVGPWGLDHSCCLIPKMLDLEVRALCRTVQVSHTELRKLRYLFMAPTLCMGHCHLWTGMGFPPKYCHKVGSLIQYQCCML